MYFPIDAKLSCTNIFFFLQRTLSPVFDWNLAGVGWPVRGELGIAGVLQLYDIRGPDTPHNIGDADLSTVLAHVSQRGQFVSLRICGRRHVHHPHYHHPDRGNYRYFRLYDVVSMYDKEIPIL